MKCPSCGEDGAYQGITPASSIECLNTKCDHFSRKFLAAEIGREEPQEPQAPLNFVDDADTPVMGTEVPDWSSQFTAFGYDGSICVKHSCGMGIYLREGVEVHTYIRGNPYSIRAEGTELTLVDNVTGDSCTIPIKPYTELASEVTPQETTAQEEDPKADPEPTSKEGGRLSGTGLQGCDLSIHIKELYKLQSTPGKASQVAPSSSIYDGWSRKSYFAQDREAQPLHLSNYYCKNPPPKEDPQPVQKDCLNWASDYPTIESVLSTIRELHTYRYYETQRAMRRDLMELAERFHQSTHPRENGDKESWPGCKSK